MDVVTKADAALPGLGVGTAEFAPTNRSAESMNALY